MESGIKGGEQVNVTFVMGKIKLQPSISISGTDVDCRKSIKQFFLRLVEYKMIRT